MTDTFALHMNNRALSTPFEYINTIYSIKIIPIKFIKRLNLYYIYKFK